MTQREEYERRKEEEERNRTKKNARFFSDLIRDRNFIVQFLLVIFTGGLIVVGYLQRQTLDDQRAVLEKTDQTLQLGQRPWVSAQIGISGDLTYEKGTDPTLEFVFLLKNTGRLPAINVQTKAAFYTPGSRTPNPERKQIEVCSSARNAPIGFGSNGVSLFPNEDFTDKQLLTITKTDIRESFPEAYKADEIGLFSPWLVGCVTYRFANDKLVHVTPFIATLGIFDATHPYAIISPDTRKGTVKSDLLRIWRWPMGMQAD